MPPTGPDLALGVSSALLPDNAKLVGHVGDEEVLLVRTDGTAYAVGAHCSHYHAPLVDGLVVDGEIRCPWHHAAFSLSTGHCTRPPALNAIAVWDVDERAGTLRVTRRTAAAPHRTAAPHIAATASTSQPSSVVIIGGGAAGAIAAETLRHEGYAGPVTIIDPDADAPYDRPNISKDFLAGSAPEEWLPLRDDAFYASLGIVRTLGRDVTAISTAERTVRLEDGTTIPYGALLLANGAEPVRLPLDDAHHRVRALRSLKECRAIIAQAAAARCAVIIGSSFLGLEMAASLRARGLAIHVVAPETVPFQRVLGAELGTFVRALHEDHGVVFHLGTTVHSVGDRSVTLADGTVIEADMVLSAVGVTPRTALAKAAGLAVKRGIVVDEYLRTSAPDVYAAGDVAEWFDIDRGQHLNVQHWVVAQRQGMTAAHNMLGWREPFTAVPFFWSQHYDVAINYVGVAPAWDTVTIDGSIEGRDCSVRYWENGRLAAVATVSRDGESLLTERDMEQRRRRVS